MKYQPLTAVWEITMGCNMRCMHCGSSCESAMEDELTTQEALELCQQISEMGLKWVTLSGGEPFTRKDWPLIVNKLTQNGVMANIISNGWMIDEATLKTAKKNNVSTIALSVDGTKNVHDKIRRTGSFERISKAFELMDEMEVVSGAVTTVSTKNINILDDIKDFLISKNVKFWQLQIGLPMGNMAKNSEMTIQPDSIDFILDFIHKSAKEGKIKVYPADCIGYYNKKESEIRKILFLNDHETHWDGCHAGKRSFGILQNGEILGCTSIRNREFVEGSIRNRSLREIWEDDDSFEWSRHMSKSKLKGHCRTCDFGDLCLGGCPNTRLTTRGSVYEENKYCSYNHALEKTKTLVENISDSEILYRKAERYARENELSLSYIVLKELMNRSIDEKTLNLFGYVSFMAGDFESSKKANEEVLKLNKKNTYALKGLGLCEYRIGKEIKMALEHLKQAVDMNDEYSLDAMNDLAVVYYEIGKYQEAKCLLEDGMRRSYQFGINTSDLYDKVCMKA